MRYICFDFGCMFILAHIEYVPSIGINYFTDFRFSTGKEDAIIRKWITVQKNLAVEVNKQNNDYRAKNNLV